MPAVTSAVTSAATDAAPLPAPLAEKQRALERLIAGFGSAITAFSGGVDSSLVAYVAHRALGARALAVTSRSESLTRDDEALTRRLAAEWAMAHRSIQTAELANPAYRANPENRCYFCKSTLYADLAAIARAEGYAALLNGTNADDLGDHRPGLRAAREHGVRSPLAECGFSKADVRGLAGSLGLSNADKPQAACLSSRVPYGIAISLPVLAQIEQAEGVLRRLGFSQLRVRHHDTLARIEVPPQEFARVLEHRREIERELAALGYRYVTLDLKGFRSGSLNEGLARR